MSIALMSLACGLDIPQSEKMVLLCLCDYANDKGQCWPSVETMARKCSVSDRTVQRTIRKLVDDGLVSVIDSRGRVANTYVIRLPQPRHSVTPTICHPDTVAPSTPTMTTSNPDTVSPKPSKNHQEEPSRDRASGDAPLTLDELVKDWNATAKALGLQQIQKLTADRQKKGRSQIRRFALDEWQSVFAKISQSPFLLGENDRGWRCDFDFILIEKNFVKILEGKYDRQTGSRH